MKHIIIGTTRALGQSFWTATFAENPDDSRMGQSVPEAIGTLTSKEFEITYTDTAKQKLEFIQRTVARMDAAKPPLSSQEQLDREAPEFYINNQSSDAHTDKPHTEDQFLEPVELPELLKALLHKVEQPHQDPSDRDAIIIISACHNLFSEMKEKLEFEDFDFKNEEHKLALHRAMQQYRNAVARMDGIKTLLSNEEQLDQQAREFYRKNSTNQSPVDVVSRHEIGLGLLDLSEQIAENFNPGQ